MDKSHIPFSSSSLAPLPPLEPVELENDINLRVLLAGVWDEALSRASTAPGVIFTEVPPNVIVPNSTVEHLCAATDAATMD